MPKPPILPQIDWEGIFESGETYRDWLEAAEDPKQREAMEEGLINQPLEPQEAGFLRALPREVRVLAIAEDWCGDVVRHVPVLQRLAQEAPKLKVRYITRAEHPYVFARFLTNGGEAIPKFIFFNEDFVECGNWGPMPAQHRELIARGKACNDVSDARERVAALYAADPHKRVVVRELLAHIDIAASTAP